MIQPDSKISTFVWPGQGVLKPGHCCASVEGFSVHAEVSVRFRDRIRLERLLRYAARPPLSNERLSLLPDSRLRYKLKRRWSDGTACSARVSTEIQYHKILWRASAQVGHDAIEYALFRRARPVLAGGFAHDSAPGAAYKIACLRLDVLPSRPDIQILRAHIASGPERNKGWLRAIFDPQIGTALSAIHDSVSTPWTVESLAGAAGMSRSAFAARFKDLLGQTPLEYVTEWRMQKAMQLLQQRDKKHLDVARLVGYESDAAFSKAFKRVVGANPGEYLKRGI